MTSAGGRRRNSSPAISAHIRRKFFEGLNFLFSGEAEPACAEATDTNADGTVNITDGIYLLTFLFTGGAGPPAPYPECGRINGLPEDQCKSFDPCPQDG